MTTITAPMCVGCKYFRQDEQRRIACDAYPGGIPDAIIESTVDHRQPYAGDRGIQFEPVTPDDGRYAVELFGSARENGGAIVAGMPYTAGKRGPELFRVEHDGWVIPMAYSPGQKRDTKGKFGSGGGSGGLGTGMSGAGGAGESVEGIENKGKLQDRTDNALPPMSAPPPGGGYGNLGHGGAVEIASQKLKAQAMRDVGADLDAQFSAEQLESAYQPFRRDSSGRNGDTPGERMADAMLNTWSQGAYSLEKPNTVAVQIAVAQEFKTGVGANIQKDFDEAGVKVDDWPATLGYDVPVMKASVRSMYDHTQARLDEMGVKGGVTLHRGVGRSDLVGRDSSVDFNPASSWSHDRSTADSFAQHQGVENAPVGGPSPTGTRLTMTVPRERILALPGTGMGCYEEGEAIVLRANGDQARGEEPGGYDPALGEYQE